MKGVVDNVKKIQKLDTCNMHELLENFSKAIEDAYDIISRFEVPSRYKKKYTSICFSGLGGSAIGADFIKSYLEDEITIPIIVNREYTIPALVGKDTLFIVSSYSGNTEETLSAYKAAREKGVDIIALSSNGKLMDWAVKDGVPFIRIPGQLPPRAALAYGTVPFLKILADIGLISSKDRDIKDAAKTLNALKKSFRSKSPKAKNMPKKIANRLHGRFPVIYGASVHVNAVVTRWRGQLAENSKTISSSHTFPEMNHNEIVGWENPKKFLKGLAVLFLKDKDDHPRVKLRMDITKSIIKKVRPEIIEVESSGKSLLARLFSLVYIGDWVSFYLAILNDVDPTPVDRVMYLKKKLSE